MEAGAESDSEAKNIAIAGLNARSVAVQLADVIKASAIPVDHWPEVISWLKELLNIQDVD